MWNVSVTPQHSIINKHHRNIPVSLPYFISTYYNTKCRLGVRTAVLSAWLLSCCLVFNARSTIAASGSTMGYPIIFDLSDCGGLKNDPGQQHLFNLVWLSMDSKKDVNSSTVVDFGLTRTLWTFVGTRDWIYLRKIEIDY